MVPNPPQNNTARGSESQAEVEEPMHKKLKPDYTNTYKIHVMEEDGRRDTPNIIRKEFIIHKALVDERSPGLLEASHKRKRGVNGLEYEYWAFPGAFQTFVHWLYTSEVDISPLYGSKQNAQGEAEVSWPALAALWYVAHYSSAFELCNEVTNLMLDKFDASLLGDFSTTANDSDEFWETVKIVYKGTDRETEIRTLLLDMFFTVAAHHPTRFNQQLVTKENLFQMALEAMQRTQSLRIPMAKEERVQYRGRYHKVRSQRDQQEQ